MNDIYDQSAQGDEMALGLLMAMALIGLVWLVIVIFTAISIIRSDKYSTTGKAGWILGILGFPFIPFLAVLLWFFWARSSTGAPRMEPPSPGYPPMPHSGTAYGPNIDGTTGPSTWQSE